jgi:hypothetical protein
MVADLFPKHTAMMRTHEESTALRRFSRSIAEMALITGVLLRVFRSLVLSHATSGLWFVAMLTIAAVFLVGMATAHLANYPLYRWVWRVPVFVALEVVGEMVTSLFLIWVGREPYGAVRAHMIDWPSLMIRSFFIRGVIVVVWSAILAGIVLIVRTRLVKEEPDEPNAFT